MGSQYVNRTRQSAASFFSVLTGGELVFNTARERWLRPALKTMAILAAVGLPLGLFVGGAQPVAVGLIPSPWDKLVHVFVFAVLSTSIGYAGGLKGRRLWLFAFCGAVLVAALDEWHQMYLPGRSASLDDLMADVVGAATGCFGLHIWANVKQYWLSRRSAQNQ
jgi:uncharacterized protein YfiM (DUF2279 family)